jgi:type IV conjugative transfer system coupling protein TraD
MSRYSDHTTVGGQVLAHRFRMMKQNWRVILTIGKFSWLLFFLGYLLHSRSGSQIWNYFCCLKASWRAGMSSLPHNLFGTSFMCDGRGNFEEFSDFFIARSNFLMQFKENFEQFLLKDLKLSIGFALLLMAVAVYFNKKLGKSLTEDKELISGHNYVDAKTLRKVVKNKSDVTLADIPYPRGSETRHTLITGTTGAGKTNVIKELINQVTPENEKMIVVDTVGTFAGYHKDGRDIILNPLDPKSVGWSFFGECDDDALGEILLKSVAACLIDCGNAQDKFWEEAARIVFVETAKKAIREKKTTAEFLEILLKISLRDIQDYLEGTYGHSLMDRRADKMAISVRATLINAVSVFDILRDLGGENFSIRNWIASPKNGILFLSCTPAQRAAVTPLITAWLAAAAESLLRIAPTDKRTWFVIDELHNLKRLPRLDISLAEVRKFGGCFVMGTQMISQLNTIYGHETAKTVTGLCGTKIVMNIPEPITAKYMSDFLGEIEETTTAEAISYGANTVRDGVNISKQNAKKAAVPPGEIMNLKIGEAFVKFSSVDLAAKVKFELHESEEPREERQQAAQPESEVISAQDYVKTLSCSPNDPIFYGIPLNDTITSKPIYVFDEDTTPIAKFLDDARAKNKRIIVFEDGSKFYDSCFRKDCDILLNPKRDDGFAWDMLGEFEGNYLKFADALIKSADIDGEKLAIAEEYFFKVLSHLTHISITVDTVNVLNKLLFYPFKETAADFVEMLGISDKDMLLKYSGIRDYLSLKFNCLRPKNDKIREISAQDYVGSNRYDGSILFVSCFADADIKDFLSSILESACLRDAWKVFSTKHEVRKMKNCIVTASDMSEPPIYGGTVISSSTLSASREHLGRIFRDALQGNYPEASCFIRPCGFDKIICVNFGAPGCIKNKNSQTVMISPVY